MRQLKTEENASEDLKARSIEVIYVHTKAAIRHMGELTSSENSLNQHIKNKHKELWETIKVRCEGAESKGGHTGHSPHDSDGDSRDNSDDDVKDARIVDFAE